MIWLHGRNKKAAQLQKIRAKFAWLGEQSLPLEASLQRDQVFTEYRV